MAADVGTGCAAGRREDLCNHFYFPLLPSLLSDLDCISQGRQRQNKGMLVTVRVRVCLLLGAAQGCGVALRMVGGRFTEKGVAKLRCN